MINKKKKKKIKIKKLLIKSKKKTIKKKQNYIKEIIYLLRVRVRCNSDSKKLKVKKEIRKKSTRAKMSPCKIVCSSKSVFVLPHANLTATHI